MTMMKINSNNKLPTKRYRDRKRELYSNSKLQSTKTNSRVIKIGRRKKKALGIDQKNDATFPMTFSKKKYTTKEDEKR